MLHMDDQISGHGFLPVYTGSDTSHISTGLRRNASYKFRLQAQNEEGKSPWSDEVSYYTLPDIPGPPLRPASKGRLHPHSFKVLMCIFESNNCFSILHLLILQTYIKNYCNIFIAIKLQCLLICNTYFFFFFRSVGIPHQMTVAPWLKTTSWKSMVVRVGKPFIKDPVWNTSANTCARAHSTKSG